MAEIREIAEGEPLRAPRALLELRPQRARGGDLLTLAALADGQRAAGYRLVGSFEPGEDDAAGGRRFRVQGNLAWGRHLYVDDLITRADRRGRGHGAGL